MNYVVESYQNYKEENRLTTNNARKIEFITTARVLSEILPANGKVLDCAAGTGIYAFYFADKGYDVTALDITPRHIDIINEQLKDKDYNMITGVNDATNLSQFEDESFDIVLCMGPIYHITDNILRDKCINECLRVLKKDGCLVVAYISKYFIFPFIATSDKKYLNTQFANQMLGKGIIKHDDPNCFWTDSYYTSPEEMETSFVKNHLQIIDHIAVDGLTPFFLRTEVDAMNDEEFTVWCNYHYSICREKNILGASNHGLIIGRK